MLLVLSPQLMTDELIVPLPAVEVDVTVAVAPFMTIVIPAVGATTTGA